ncbi:MAG TPA: lysophospholipid acyltransferase family protein [Ferruginibacter sp.]|jgi:1-acyl-sn-glycerol-3-phosphate acyltransferase|nr:lysophospholipid acyltransferase family protein [Ferruginibacter sp.]
MRYLLFPLRLLYTIYVAAMFVAFLLISFPIVVVASFFGKIRGGNFIFAVCRLWTDIQLILCGVFHRNIYEVPHDNSKQYVFVVNHISYMDIPIMLQAVRKQHFRILGKAEISKVPLFGLIYRNVVILVDRTSTSKRATSAKQLTSVIKKGISVLICPEGTFNETHRPLKEFYDGAFKIAIETQTPVKPILFLDTYDLLNYNSMLSLTPGRSRAVYLDEISVEGLTVKDTKALKDKVYKIMEERLIFYKASWIQG